MKYTVVLILIISFPFILNAQAKSKPQSKNKTQSKDTAQPKEMCVFERLFNLKSGMDMPAAVAALSKSSKMRMISQSSEKLKPYSKTGGDSILHQTITYKVDSAQCLHGKDDYVRFEFADGRLYKAYIETTYDDYEFADMMTNFDYLHKDILRLWKYEKQITISGNNTQGTGYNFYKTLDKNVKLDMCNLQYVKVPSGTGKDKYKLEILWVNLNNTRMENSMY
jgi:hypothetical protein